MTNEVTKQLYDLIRDIKVEVAELRAEMRTVLPEREKRLKDCEQKLDQMKTIIDRDVGAKSIIAVLGGIVGAIIVAIVGAFATKAVGVK